jgi:hypothetical protein
MPDQKPRFSVPLTRLLGSVSYFMLTNEGYSLSSHLQFFRAHDACRKAVGQARYCTPVSWVRGE